MRLVWLLRPLAILVSQKMIADGYRIPRGYGRAYRCWNRDAIVVYLIPFNWIVGFFRQMHFLLRRGLLPSRLEREMIRRFNQGRVQAFKEGFEAGRNALVKDIVEGLTLMCDTDLPNLFGAGD